MTAPLEPVTFLDGLVTLYCGDCRDIAPKIAEPFDLVATDPPYRLIAGGNTSGGMIGGWMTEYDNAGAPVTCDITWEEIAAVCFAALGEDGDCYVMANDKNLIPAGVAALAEGFELHNVLAWNKVTATANRWYMKNLEFTLYLFKGRARRINDCASKQLLTCPQIDVSPHPTEKPVALMAHYIGNSTRVGARVLDPFMGSGTTGVACVQLGRSFVGIELERKYFDIACARIADAIKRPTLFSDGAPRWRQAKLFDETTGVT